MSKFKPVVCKFCNVEFTDEYDAERICGNAIDANACSYSPSKRAKFKPQVVDENYVPIENDPMRLDAIQSLINDGAAWHPDIDQDGCIGRQANDLINRKILKAPRGQYAKMMPERFAFMAELDSRTRRLV